MKKSISPEKVVLYARVSSKEQEKEGFSIPAQLELLRNYATKNSMIILKEFEDVETAKCQGRTNFNEMLKYIKNSKECNTILVEKTDRLYRNIPDYATVDDLGIDIHFVKENTIISQNSHSSEKFMQGIKVLMARQYIQNLGEEVTKGLTQKAKDGYVTGKPPYGYTKHFNDKKTSYIDEETAPYVVRAFELYAQGNISLRALSQKLYDEGFIYKPNTPKAYKTQLENILKNPFYYGMVVFKKTLYAGKHQPLISKDLFDRTQLAFRKDNKPKHFEPREFLFAGMVKCSKCGCNISGEIKKGKYIYYSCTGGRGECEQQHIYIPEAKIEKQIIQALENISITQEHREWITQALKESFNDEEEYTKQQIHSLSVKKQKLKERIDKIYLDKLDGNISEDFWAERHNQWTQDLLTIQSNITAYEKASINFIEQGANFLKICYEMHDLYQFGNCTEKRELINYVLQNLKLEGENIHYDYKKPFDIFGAGLNRNKKLPRLDSNQQPTG